MYLSVAVRKVMMKGVGIIKVGERKGVCRMKDKF